MIALPKQEAKVEARKMYEKLEKEEYLKEQAQKLKSIIAEANKIIEELNQNCLYVNVKQPTGRFLKIDILKSF
nr:hypothetical protein [Flavobacterium sp.]